MWPHLPVFQIFPCGQNPKNGLLGSLPKPGTSGQLGPKSSRPVGLVCVMALLLHFLVFLFVCQAEQAVNIRFDCHQFSHIRPGSSVLGVQCLFVGGQPSRLCFQGVHLWKLRSGQYAAKGRLCRPVQSDFRFMLAQKLIAVPLGLVFLKHWAGLGILPLIFTDTPPLDET